MKYDYETFRNKEHIKKIFPFSSERKKMATCYEDTDGKTYVFVKGAPEFLIYSCSHFIDQDGLTSKISQHFRNRL